MTVPVNVRKCFILAIALGGAAELILLNVAASSVLRALATISDRIGSATVGHGR